MAEVLIFIIQRLPRTVNTGGQYRSVVFFQTIWSLGSERNVIKFKHMTQRRENHVLIICIENVVLKLTHAKVDFQNMLSVLDF